MRKGRPRPNLKETANIYINIRYFTYKLFLAYILVAIFTSIARCQHEKIVQIPTLVIILTSSSTYFIVTLIWKFTAHRLILTQNSGFV